MKWAFAFVSVFVLTAAPVFAWKPKPAENEFIKIEGADLFMIPDKKHKDEPPQMIFSFMFTLKKPLTLTHVRVEDLTAKPPVTLVDDASPKIKKQRNESFWNEKAAGQAFNPQNFPWVFERGNTKKKFRFTVSSKEAPDFSLEQSAVYDRSEKAIFLRMGAKHLNPAG